MGPAEPCCSRSRGKGPSPTGGSSSRPGTRSPRLENSKRNARRSAWDSGAGIACRTRPRGSFESKGKLVAAALTFLAANRVSIGFDSSALYDAMIALAEKEIGKPELAELLRKLTRS